MKKLISSIAAVLMLTSCSTNSDKNIISEPVEELPPEPVFTEYNEEDFRIVDVDIAVRDDEPPVDITGYSFPTTDGTAKLSKCKEGKTVDEEIDTEGIPESALEDYIKYEQERIDAQKKQLEEPSYGYIKAFYADEDALYYIVDYDNDPFCYLASHCFEIYKYDMVNDERSVIYSYDNGEYGYDFYNIKCVNGDIYVSGYCGDESEYDNGDYAIFRLNSETGEPERFENEKLNAVFGNRIKATLAIDNYLPSDRLSVSGFADAGDNENWVYTICEYDFDKKDWEIKSEEENSGRTLGNGRRISDRGNYIRTYVEDRYTVCEEDGVFRLNTKLRGATLQCVSKNKVTLVVQDTMNFFLYVYDLDKMECYKYDIKNYGSYLTFYPLGDFLFADTQYGYVNFVLIPDLGVAFQLRDVFKTSVFNDNKVICYDNLLLDRGDTYYSYNNSGYRVVEEHNMSEDNEFKYYVIKAREE